MSNDRFVVSPRLRRLGVTYVAITVPLVGMLSWSVEGRAAYIDTLLLAGIAYTVPVVVLAMLAAHRAAAADRLVWRIWAFGAAGGAVSSYVFYLRSQEGWDEARSWSPPAAVLGVVILLVANTLILRRRSGERAALVDAVDLLMATIAATVPLAMVWGDEVVDAPASWFTVTASVWVIGAFHGLFVGLVVRARLRPDERTNANIGIVLGVVGVVSSMIQVQHALRGFPAPGGPGIAAHAAFLGMVLLFFLFSASAPSTGLERLPAAAQVRRQSIVVIGVLAAVPLIAGLAWWQRDEDWVVATAIGATGALLVLSGIRHLLSARETTRLYSEVERAAVERGELLAEVMAHVDADRHRVAAHLHRQAVSLYTTVATLSCTLDAAVDAGAPTSATRAVERMRDDLGRRADSLRSVALAVKPLSPLDGPSQGLAATVRAYVENLYGDDPRPALEVSVAADLVLDWTTEAIVVRILQEATNNVWRHAGASVVKIDVGTTSDVLYLEVADDGSGVADHSPDGRGLHTMRSMAGFLGGALTVEGYPGSGTRVRAELPIDALPDPPRPTLSVVR